MKQRLTEISAGRALTESSIEVVLLYSQVRRADTPRKPIRTHIARRLGEDVLVESDISVVSAVPGVDLQQVDPALSSEDWARGSRKLTGVVRGRVQARQECSDILKRHPALGTLVGLLRSAWAKLATACPQSRGHPLKCRQYRLVRLFLCALRAFTTHAGCCARLSLFFWYASMKLRCTHERAAEFGLEIRP